MGKSRGLERIEYRAKVDQWVEGHPDVEGWVSSVAPDVGDQYGRCLYEFIDWLSGDKEFLGCTPESLLEYQERADKRDRVRIANKLSLFCQSLARTHRPNTVRNYFGAIRLFFNFHGVSIPRRRWNLPEDYKETSPQLLDRDSLLRIFNTAKLRDKAMIQIAFGSGMGWNEFNQFNRSWPTVKAQLEEDRKYIRIDLRPRKQNREGGKTFFTIIGKDGVNLLKEYLAMRGEPENGEAIFFGEEEEGVPTPMSGRNYRRVFLSLARRAGLVNGKQSGEGARYGYSPHQLRDTLRTEWQRTGADNLVVEFMMGHEVDPNLYLKFMKIPDYVVEQYRIAEPRLSLLSNPHPDLVRKDEVEDLRDQVQQLQTQGERVKKLEALLEDPELYDAFIKTLGDLKKRKLAL